MYEIDGQRVLNSRGVASILGVGRNKFLAWLRTHKIFMAGNTPNPRYDRSGFFLTREGINWHAPVTYWTLDGLNAVKPLIEAAVAQGEIKAEKKAKSLVDISIEDLDRWGI